MSVRTDVINLNVNVNGNAAQNDLNNLRKRAADLKFEMEGLNKRTAEYRNKKKDLAEVQAQMTTLKQQIGITALSQKELVQELNKLKALRGSVVPFSNEYKELSKSIKQVENRLYEVKNGVQGFSSFFSKIKDEVKQFGVIAAGYLGFQFITSQFQNIIRTGAKLSDQLADLQRVAGFTAQEAKNLNKELSGLNSRTSTEGLRQIAISAGKLGVAKADIVGFTQAVDMLVVTLGDELGNADQITDQLGKILNVFDGKINADNITRLGNAFVDLANTGSATGGFIADFDQRLSGIAKSSGISLGALSGLGAGMEEMGARVESSATAIQKLIISIASDIPAAAKIAGQSTAEFNKLFQMDPTEALLKYSEGLVKNKQSFAAVTASLKDAGEEGARTIETITKLGTSADMMRKRIDQGKKSIEETAAVTEGFALKNETFGATLEKLGKEFNRLVTSSTVTEFLKAAVNGTIEFIQWLKQLPEFIERNRFTITSLTVAMLVLTRSLYASALAWAVETAAMVLDTVIKARNAVVTVLVRTATLSLAIAQALLAGNTTRAAAAWALLSKTFLASPIGWIIAGGIALSLVLDNIFSKTKNLTEAQKLNNEIEKRSTESISDHIGVLKTKLALANNENVSLKGRQKALNEVKAASDGYLDNLTLENLKTAESISLIDQYIGRLKMEAKAKAVRDLSAEKEKRKFEVENALDQLNAGFDIDDEVGGSAFLKNLLSGVGLGKGTTGNQIRALRNELGALDGDLTSLYKRIEKDGSIQAAIAGTTTVSTVTPAGPTDAEKKARENEYERLKKEAEKFHQDILKLKENATIKGKEPEAEEVAAVEAKYRDLTAKAKEFYLKQIIDKSKLSQEEIIIEEAKQQELNNIFQKYFKQRMDEAATKEYDQSLLNSQEYFDKRKIQLARDFADNKLTQDEYNKAVMQLEHDALENRIIIATDYSEAVKKAATDVVKFKKQKEQEVTKDLVDETIKRKQLTNDEAIAKAERGVLAAQGKGVDPELQARKFLLEEKFRVETEAMDKTSEMYKLKQDELNQALLDADNASKQQRLDNVLEYVGYFQQALSSLNQFVSNRENRELQQDKKANDTKKKNLKNQFDDKLISQKQYDLQVQKLDEEHAKKENALKRKQAEREKALNIFNAIVGNASAIVKTMASVPFPANIPLAIAQGIAGGLQIAAIANTPLPEFGEGDWIRKGAKHKDKSRGIPVLIERDEAVMKAAAMTDKEILTVTGNTAQITAALNARKGGVNWAGGAVVEMPKWRTERPASLNPGLPLIMEQGGIVRQLPGSDNGSSTANLEGLVRTLIEEQRANTDEIKNMKTKLHAVVSIKEYRQQEALYDASKSASGINQ